LSLVHRMPWQLQTTESFSGILVMHVCWGFRFGAGFGERYGWMMRPGRGKGSWVVGFGVPG